MMWGLLSILDCHKDLGIVLAGEGVQPGQSHGGRIGLSLPVYYPLLPLP